MDREATVDRLLAGGVVVAGDDGSLGFGEAFEDAVADHRAALEEAGPDAVGGTVEAAGVAGPLRAVAELDRDFVACALALASTADLPAEDLVDVTVVLQQFRGEPPAFEGVPEGFLPMACDQVETVLALYPRAVLYVWREDCAPCDLVREDLAGIFAEPPPDVAPLAVYAPGCVVLDERYDVAVCPTVLFTVDGEVDARLLGAHPRAVYEREIETLRSR